jgi:hypothetical protein
MSILVIPLILWGVKLEVRLAVQDQQIVSLQESLKTVQGFQGRIGEIATTQGRLEEKINATNENLREVKELLRLRPQPYAVGVRTEGSDRRGDD